MCCNLIAEGDGNYNRSGTKIKLQSLRIRGFINTTFGFQAVSKVNNQLVRLCLVWDSAPAQLSGTLPAYNEIFGSINSSGGLASNTMSPVVPAKNTRFRILYDEVFEIQRRLGPQKGWTTEITTGSDSVSAYNAVDPTEEGHCSRTPFDRYIDVSKRNMESHYTNASATYSSIVKGALYLVQIATSADKVNLYSALLHSTVRVRYTDN